MIPAVVPRVVAAIGITVSARIVTDQAHALFNVFPAPDAGLVIHPDTAQQGVSPYQWHARPALSHGELYPVEGLQITAGFHYFSRCVDREPFAMCRIYLASRATASCLAQT